MFRKATAALLFCAALATFGACKKETTTTPAATTAKVTYKAVAENVSSYSLVYKDASGTEQTYTNSGPGEWSVDLTVTKPFSAMIAATGVKANPDPYEMMVLKVTIQQNGVDIAGQNVNTNYESYTVDADEIVK